MDEVKRRDSLDEESGWCFANESVLIRAAVVGTVSMSGVPTSWIMQRPKARFVESDSLDEGVDLTRCPVP